jgi:cell division protein FtsB
MWIGMEWRAFESRSAAKASVKDSRWIYVFGNDTSQWVAAGVAPEEEGEANQKTICGAAAVAQCERNAIVYQALPEGGVWVCAVKDGLPLPGFDVVCDAKAAASVFSEAVSYVDRGQVYGSARDAKGTLEQLFEGLTPQHVKRLRLKKKAPVAVFASLVAVSVLIAVGAIGATVWHARTETKEALERAMRMAQLQTEAQKKEAEAKALAQMQASISKQREELRSIVPASRQLEAWVAAVERVSLAAAGYRLVGISCDENACSASWDLANRLLPAAWPEDGAGDSPAPSGSQIQDKLSTQLPIEGAAIAKIARAEDTFLILAQQTRMFNGLAGLAVTVASPQPIFAVAPKGVENAPRVEIGKSGTVTIAGRLPILREFIAPLDQHLQLKKFSVSVREGGKGSIQLEGAYVWLAKN